MIECPADTLGDRQHSTMGLFLERGTSDYLGRVDMMIR
jgi:hypothetical protein